MECFVDMYYSGGLVTTHVPQDVNNPYQYVPGTPRTTPHATTTTTTTTTDHPLITGLQQQQQQPSLSQSSSYELRRSASNNVSKIVNSHVTYGSSYAV